MAASQFDPFGYRALTAAIAQLRTDLSAERVAVLAAIDNPAWLRQPTQTKTSVAGTTFYPVVVDVGGQIYAKLDQVATNLTSLERQEHTDMAAVDDALAGLNTAVQAVSADLAKYAADLQAALDSNNTAALQQAIDGINGAATALNAAVAANQAP